MKTNLLLFFACILFSNAFAQNPLVKIWDKDFGGTDYDILISIQQTSDHGYILGGYSISSIGGDKTQNSWGVHDYWIVKTDSLGNKLWDKNFGGNDNDYLESIQPTTDGGFILGGSSLSAPSGNKLNCSRCNCIM